MQFYFFILINLSTIFIHVFFAKNVCISIYYWHEAKYDFTFKYNLNMINSFICSFIMFSTDQICRRARFELSTLYFFMN